jgi:DNA-binding response OmpR family regulator
MNDLNILVVDDDSEFRNGVERYLRLQGCTNVRAAYSGEEAVEMVKKDPPTIVLLDVYLPRMNGLVTLGEIRKINKDIVVFMLTGEADEEYRQLAAKFGALDYLLKPIPMDVLYAHILKRSQGHSSNARAA